MVQTDQVSESGQKRLLRPVGPGDLLDLLALLDAAGLIALFYANESGLARLLLTVGFVFFVPGRAIVDNWPFLRRWSEVAMSLILSITVVGLLATVILWAHIWHPLVLFQVEAWLSMAGLGVGAARRQGLLTGMSARLPRFLRNAKSASDKNPTWVGLMDLDAEDRIVGPGGPLRQEHVRATLLVRTHRAPLGYVRLPPHPTDSLAERARAEAEKTLGKAIRDHIENDALAKDPTTPQSWFARAVCPLRFVIDNDAIGLTIAVCTRDRPELLRECLHSLQQVIGAPIEILVVDNAPTQDKTRQLVEALAEHDPRIRYTCEPKPGLSRARNRALTVALFDLVAFTDDDVSVDPGWPTALVAGFSLDPEVVCVTGLVASATLDTASQRYFDARIPWGELFEPRRYDLDRHRSPYPLYPFNAGMFGTGANFAVRAQTVKKVGGFDPCLGVGSPGRGGEDLDMFLRLILAGGRICYLPSALVWHRHRDKAAALRGQMFDYGNGLGAYLAKHIGKRDLRRALLKYGLSHARSMLGRMTRASRQTALGLTGMELAFSEARGLTVGALRYWWGAFRATKTSDEAP